MRLETSQQLLERVRASLGDDVSYYRVSKVIGATDGTIANWRHGRSGIGREYVAKVAELLGEKPEYILACVEHEREQHAGAKRFWQRIAEAFRSSAASIVLVGLLGTSGLFSPAGSEASAARGAPAPVNPHIHYANYGRRLRRWLRRLLSPPACPSQGPLQIVTLAAI